MITVEPLPADFADWRAMLDLVKTAFAYMDDRIDPPSSAHRLTEQSLARKSEDEICFLARDSERLIGCIFCKPEEPGCLYIGKLAIRPDQQGRGIGRRLLSAAEDAAGHLGLPALRLETRIELTGNHATFLAWGFARTAEKSHAGYTRTTFIEMRKPLV